MKHGALLALLPMALAVGCVDHPAPPAHDTTSDGDESGGSEFPDVFGVTADWRNHSISVVDVNALRSATDATTRDDVVFATVDLPEFEPGPIEVEVVPFTRTAVVSVGPGFFDGVVGNLIGATNLPSGGALLLVDLQSGTVEGMLDRPNPPMGIAIDAMGDFAYVANYASGGDTMSVIDLAEFVVVDEVDVGPGPEQISLNSDGTLGIINLAGDGTVRVFETADPTGTLSAPLEVSNDSSWVFFIDGTDLAVVINSANDRNFTVIDVSDPAAPALVAQGPEPQGVPYSGAPIPGTTEFVIVDTIVDHLGVSRADATAPDAFGWQHALVDYNSFPLGIAVDPDGQHLYLPAPGDDQLLVFDMQSDTTVAIDWLGRVGPTYFALAPL